jgi:gas vesicle protein
MTNKIKDTIEIKETKKNGLLKGIIIGSSVGAVTTLLLAPKSGTKIRGEISSTYRVLNEKTLQLASTIGQKTQELVKTVCEQTTELVDKAKDAKKHVLDSYVS